MLWSKSRGLFKILKFFDPNIFGPICKYKMFVLVRCGFMQEIASGIIRFRVDPGIFDNFCFTTLEHKCRPKPIGQKFWGPNGPHRAERRTDGHRRGEEHITEHKVSGLLVIQQSTNPSDQISSSRRWYPKISSADPRAREGDGESE